MHGGLHPRPQHPLLLLSCPSTLPAHSTAPTVATLLPLPSDSAGLLEGRTGSQPSPPCPKGQSLTNTRSSAPWAQESLGKGPTRRPHTASDTMKTPTRQQFPKRRLGDGPTFGARWEPGTLAHARPPRLMGPHQTSPDHPHSPFYRGAHGGMAVAITRLSTAHTACGWCTRAL